MTTKSLVNFVFALATVTLAAGSGSWGCGGPNETAVNASIAVPFELLTIDDYEVQLTLLDPPGATVLRGPVTLTRDEENALWVGLLEDVEEQEFLAVVDIVGPLEDGDVLLAHASRLIMVPKGAPFATLTFKPLDFDTDLDDDGDTLTNATEYAIGLDPRLVDSDGDGVSDANELK
jgi:hypothetical protein